MPIIIIVIIESFLQSHLYSRHGTKFWPWKTFEKRIWPVALKSWSHLM